MPSSDPARVLVVANRTAATPALLEAVRARAASGNATFTLLVPAATHGLDRLADPEDAASTSEAQASLDLAIPLLEEVAGGPVEGLVGDPDPFLAIQDAVNLRGFDELIISTLSPRVSRWLRLDLPRRLTVLGIPITTVTAKGQVEVANAGIDSAHASDDTRRAAARLRAALQRGRRRRPHGRLLRALGDLRAPARRGRVGRGRGAVDRRARRARPRDGRDRAPRHAVGRRRAAHRRLGHPGRRVLGDGDGCRAAAARRRRGGA